jgi:hypothetical protein
VRQLEEKILKAAKAWLEEEIPNFGEDYGDGLKHNAFFNPGP